MSYFFQKTYPPSASHRLWCEYSPSVGQEYFHCEMKRGYTRFRKKEIEVEQCIKSDTFHQKVGLLAQKVVWKFHQNPDLLTQTNAADTIAHLLKLEQESKEMQERVFAIIQNYQTHPILVGKQNLDLKRGDEGIPDPILMKHENCQLNLYAPFDCTFFESENVIHILDLKTGKSPPDKRQAYVYLLAAKYLHPNLSAVASFYNLETMEWTQPITASDEALECVFIELKHLAKRCQEERQQYKQNPHKFAQLFPPNPGKRCKNCPFTSICQYSTSQVTE